MNQDAWATLIGAVLLAILLLLVYRHIKIVHDRAEDEEWTKYMKAAESYFNRGMPVHGRDMLRQAKRIAERKGE